MVHEHHRQTLTMHPILASHFADAIRPPDRRPPWQWCEDHIAAIPYSPIPGRFRSAHSPWVRDVMENIVNPRIRLVSIIASVQSSKTTIPELTLCYIIANLPGPTLWLDQTDADARDQSESRLQQLFEQCPPVKSLFPADRHKRRNQTIHFANGMSFWILGAHNKTNLQRRSIRWLFGDETWRWPPGHMAEAEARVTAFGWLGKCVFMSQGGIEDDDTHRKFNTTDQRSWTFACPRCATRQPYLWENVQWSKDCKDSQAQYDFEKVRATTTLRCPHCDATFPDSDATRRQLNDTGLFIPQNPHASPENAGFHWNALCATSWGKLAELYLRAKAAARQGDTTLLQQFYQKRLGLPWCEFLEDYKMEIDPCGYRQGHPWTQEARVTRHGHIIPPPHTDDDAQHDHPDHGPLIPLRILTIDCQMDHFYAVIRSWAFNGSSRLIWHQRLHTWEDTESLQQRFSIHPSLVFVDAGYATYDVYRQCAARSWIALIGDRRLTFPHKIKPPRPGPGSPQPPHAIIQRFYSPRRKVAISRRSHCYMHYWSNRNIKDTLARLRHNQDPAQGPTWEIPDDATPEYLAQMESEQRVKERGQWQWQQIGRRPNHYWDCESMQAAAATMLKIIGQESTNPPDNQSDHSKIIGSFQNQ